MTADSPPPAWEPPSGGFPRLEGWIVDHEIVRREGVDYAKWHIFIRMPSGTLLEAVWLEQLPDQ